MIPAGDDVAVVRSVSRSRCCRIPNVVLTACADSREGIVEIDEANNCGVSPMATMRRADLAVVSLTLPSTGAARRARKSLVEWTVRNDGTAPTAGVWSDGIFLSTDAAIGADRIISVAVAERSRAAGRDLLALATRHPAEQPRPARTRRSFVSTRRTCCPSSTRSRNNNLISGATIDVDARRSSPTSP